MDLWTITDIAIRGSGLDISPGCEQLLRGFVASGENKLGFEPHRRAEAVENLQRFIADMIAEARRGGLGALHEITFQAARNRLCPLRPFC